MNTAFMGKYKNIVAISLLVGFIVLSYLLVNSLTPPHKISLSSFSKIKLGMDERTVIKILGCPPANYQTKPKLIGTGTTMLSTRLEEWYTDTDYIVIEFDDRDKVVFKGHMDLSNVDYTPVRDTTGIFEKAVAFLKSWF